MRFEQPDGVYGYVCTRAELAILPKRSISIYRCIKCGRTDLIKKRAMKHRRWRCLTDIFATPTGREEQ